MLALVLETRLCADCIAENTGATVPATLDVVSRLSRLLELNEKPLRCEGCGRTTLTYHAGQRAT